MSDVSRLFFFRSGLMTAVFRACGNTPVWRDMLTICWTSEAIQLKTVLKKPVGRMSRQQDEEFRCCIMSTRFLWFIRYNSVIAFELILRGNTYVVLGIDAVTACLILWIFSVKKEANSLQALVERCSDATDTGGFVNLTTVANRARALLLFLATCVLLYGTLFFLLWAAGHFSKEIFSYHRQPSF